MSNDLEMQSAPLPEFNFAQCKAVNNNEVMLSLGAYAFSVQTAAYDALRREHQYRWVSQPVLGDTPYLQYVGYGGSKIDLSGVIYPELHGGADQVQQLAAQAALGEPLSLIASTGACLGQWCISHIQEQQAEFFANGLPRQIKFQLQLLYYGENGAGGGVNG